MLLEAASSVSHNDYDCLDDLELKLMSLHQNAKSCSANTLDDIVLSTFGYLLDIEEPAAKGFSKFFFELAFDCYFRSIH